MNREDVSEKLDFARRRMGDIGELIATRRLAAEPLERQQLLQEFLFHLVGAIDLVGQFVNEVRGLGMSIEEVTISEVTRRLPSGDPLIVEMEALHVLTRGRPVPADPYSPDGYLFRIYNYRHHVTHRRRQPFAFSIGSGPDVALLIDPRARELGPAVRGLEDELRQMLELVTVRCSAAMAAC